MLLHLCNTTPERYCKVDLGVKHSLPSEATAFWPSLESLEDEELLKSDDNVFLYELLPLKMSFRPSLDLTFHAFLFVSRKTMADFQN